MIREAIKKVICQEVCGQSRLMFTPMIQFLVVFVLMPNLDYKYSVVMLQVPS